MKIVARIRKEDPALVQDLASRGVSARVVRNATVVQLPEIRRGEYEIPSIITAEGDLMLDAEENGGGMTNTGNATLVCDQNGDPLWAYYQPRRGSLACGTHAHFSAPSLVTVCVDRHRSDLSVSINRHQIDVIGHVARIMTEEVWSGNPDELPKSFDCFTKAIHVAVDKSLDYHCRRTYYATNAVA